MHSCRTETRYTGGLSNANLEGCTVLVVEDDSDTRELYATALTKLGAEVRAAPSAEDALAILADWRPDAVLCDLHLPGVDGYGLLALIRADERLGDLPVIAISASHPELEGERSLIAGFTQHLVKPTKLRDIADSVAEVVLAARKRAQ
ncbi:MAG: response regulator [Deltaproteobacteria bacterium]|nr:response regulator [Deltaproteobacteria bacterium]